MTYLAVLEQGRIAFSPRPLNQHRRHPRGVTISNYNLSQLHEILRVQRLVRQRYQPSAETRECARRYAESLYTFFGLPTVHHPTLNEHPELADLLEA